MELDDLFKSLETPPPSKPEGILESLNTIDAIIAESDEEAIEHAVSTIPCATPGCGHPQNAHDGECCILECECAGFAAPATPVPTISTPKVVIPDVQKPTPPKKGLMFAVPPQKDLPAPSTNILQITDENRNNCHHLCECGNWWTHGLRAVCKYPDLMNQGKCQVCLNGGVNADVLEHFVDGKLTAPGEIFIRNKQRLVCKEMSVEQLTNHISFLAKNIEELRIKSLETRKMRAELEEEELQNIPEDEREKFIQALRNGQSKTTKTRKPRAKKESDEPSGIRMSAYERNIANLMKRMNMTREQVEKFLND